MRRSSVGHPARMNSKLRTASPYVITLFLRMFGCSYNDYQVPVSDGALSCASPAGTYNVRWTRTSGSADCVAPASVQTILATGLDNGSVCLASAGCTSSNCTITPFNTTNCTATIRSSDACGNLGNGRVITASASYPANLTEGDSGQRVAVFALSDSSQPNAGACGFTGTGVLQ